MDERLSRSMDALREAIREDPDKVFEVLVIGSGYGGAVAAQRLAERGVRVTVLERGLEYLSGEFPDGLGKAFGQIRIDNHAASQVVGNETALFDVRLGDGLDVLVANALGGGSQINANMVIAPDDEVFEKTRHGRRLWPGTIDGKTMSVYFEQARHGLGASAFPGTFAGAAGPRSTDAVLEKPLKAQRLEELATSLQDLVRKEGRCSFDARPSLTVRHVDTATDKLLGRGSLPSGVCVGCGECVAGCNFNAKRTLTHTYLRRARAAGADLYAGVTALRLSRVADGWQVHCVATQDRRHLRRGGHAPELVLRARRVILAAGSLGSTELLLRSRSPTLVFSACLGERLATNGDNLAAAYLTQEPVNGIGQGAAGFARDAPGVGPTISGSIRVRDSGDLEREVLIQDAAIPRALAGVFHELISSYGMLVQLTTPDMRPSRGNGKREPFDWAALQARSLSHTQVLLLMGHDAAGGRITWDPCTDRLALHYPTQENQRIAEVQQVYLNAIQGRHGKLLRNPRLEPIPRNLASLLDNPPRGPSFSVHPLGGCAMGDDVTTGVVDHAGRVFDPSAGSAAAHEGLYVLDGAIVPTSLGVNPLLTITALAERAMDVLTKEDILIGEHARITQPATPGPVSQPPMRDKKTFAAAPRHVPVRFTEVMRSTVAGGAVRRQRGEPESGFAWLRDNGAFCPADAKLVLHLPLPSLEAFAADSTHTVHIPPPNADVHGIMADHDRAEFIVDEAVPAKIEPHPRQVPWARMQVVGGRVELLSTARRGNRWQRCGTVARTAITWFVVRGARDIGNWLRRIPTRRSTTGARSIRALLHEIMEWVELVARMIVHASEVRTMRYTLHLREQGRRLPEGVSHVLIGRKTVSYAASWGELFQAVLDTLWPGRRPDPEPRATTPQTSGTPESPVKRRPRLERTNVWLSLSELQLEVFDGDGRRVGFGTLGLDLIDMTRLHAPQLGLRGNTPDALITLAGYPLWMLRFLLKTRLLDFRYDFRRQERVSTTNPAERDSDPATPWPERFPALTVCDPHRPGAWRQIEAQVQEPFEVQRSARDPHTKVHLRMIRYPATTPTRAFDKTSGVHRFKAILLINGFAQSTLPFVAEELKREQGHCNMASWVYEQGFEVWMLEDRISTILDASKQASTMDEIAAYDIPSAVDRVLAQLRRDAGLAADAPAQIYALAHCVGAASLAMSLLGGHLRDPQRAYGKLAGVVFSQMQMYLVGSVSAQIRMPLSALARDALGIDYFRLSATEGHATDLERALDSLFASLPVDADQECPHERSGLDPHLDTCTCKRMTGVISRVVHHGRILPETHEKFPIYFGRANTSLLVHGSRCVENERLVNADGQNVYVTEANITRHLGIPIALLHGDENALFTVESAKRTYDQLRRIHPQLHDRKLIRQIIAKEFAHFDCTIGTGRDMKVQVLDPLAEFLTAAWEYDASATAPVQTRPEKQRRLVAPLTGPLIGWTRPAQDHDGAGHLVRVWIEVDDGASDPAEQVITWLGNMSDMVSWPVLRIPLTQWQGATADLSGWQMAPKDGAAHVAVAVAVADVFVDPSMLHDGQPIRITMLSLHAHAPLPPGGTWAHDIHGNLVGQQWGGQAESMRVMSGTAAPSSLGIKQVIDAPPVGPPQAGAATSPRLRGQALSDSDAREISKLYEALREQEQLDLETATRANPGTTSRKLRSPRQRRDGPTAQVRLEPYALKAGTPASLQFVAASCRHPGLAVERSRASFTLLDLDRRMSNGELAPQFAMMLGDQVYADATAGLADSPSPVEKMTLAYRTAFAAEGMRRITQRIPVYMAIDDHEIMDEWSADLELASPSPYQASIRQLTDAGMASFAAYQWLHSPRNLRLNSFDYSFTAQDSAIFVLDARTRRIRLPAGEKQPALCSPQQLEALKQWLDQTDDQLKIIACGSVVVPGLHTHDNGESGRTPARDADNWQLAPHQRAQLLHMIASSQSKRVVLLSGDYHCAAVSIIEFKHADGARRRACAIVAPPLYAPYPAINVHPKDVRAHESITLADRWTAEVSTEAWDGNGYAEIAALPAPDACWVQIKLRLVQFDRRRAPAWSTRQRSVLVG